MLRRWTRNKTHSFSPIMSIEEEDIYGKRIDMGQISFVSPDWLK
jgi:hypothetical protein